jgi:OPA family glycerol-3-phosphate transporter-like MFS transporter
VLVASAVLADCRVSAPHLPRFSMSSLGIVATCLATVIFVYFYNNPLKHGPWFLSRRFINWFPLGMTYSFLYMGRYNLAVAKNALGTRMDN